ncbi:MAG: hypothetical protein FJ087_04405 [Deltaproteobacteria bacterium]|nr:hypothetical protein [Deltaproteobacteria bacterium]
MSIRRSLRDRSLWAGVVPFLILLGALAYVPFASQQATVEAALGRELSRHRLLVDQVARRLQAHGLHMDACVGRLADLLASVGPEADRMQEELRVTWDVMAAQADGDGLAVIDASGSILAETGALADADPRVRAGFLDVIRSATRDRGARFVVWEGADRGVRLTHWHEASAVAGDPAGIVLATVRLDVLVRGLFGGGPFESGVSFTVTGADGSVLLHSGLAPSGPVEGARMAAAACDSCHASFPVRDRLASRIAGGGRWVVSGVERVVAYAPVGFGGQRWTISASTPAREVVRPVAQQTIVSMSFTLAVVVMLLLFGLLLRQSHIRRIRLEDALAAQARVLAVAREKERLDAELASARRMAAIGEMVARVAHEVKNPLQYIGTAADLLAGTSKDPAAVELVGDMRTGIRRLDAIVTELLDFSRPMRLDLAPVDVNGVLAEVARRVVAADATLRLDLAEGLPEVRADGYKVRQVFENLLRNALDALPAAGKGPREIEVSTRPGQGAFAGGVAAGLRDTGRGIAPADLERIWEPFFTSKTHGSGLGLAVVRRIVDTHRGEVRVESEPGRGTLFTVSLRADPRG